MADPSAASPFTAVDLSQLPAPALIETLSYEEILADMAVKVEAKHPGFDVTNEADPAVAVLQVAAYEVLLLRARVNDTAKAVMVAYATGADLDNLGALFGVARFVITEADPENQIAEVLENDADYRRRIVLGPEGFSVAGPEGAYIFHALSADPDVLDASAYSPAPGEVVVTVLGRSGTGEPAPEVLTAVADYLNADHRRPLTDMVTVQAADIAAYVVDAEITTFTGPDRAIVEAESRARVETYRDECFRLGRDITRAGLIAAIHCPGVQNTNLISPAADIVRDRTQAAYCTGITITYVGIGE